VPKGNFDLHKIKLKSVSRDIISYIGNGWESTTVASFWPLFVFLIVKNYQAVGFLTSLALIITVITTYYVGRQADKRDRSRFIKTSGLMSGVLNALQVFAITASHVMMLNLGRNLADSLGNAPYTSEYYLHADENSRSEYLYIMESMIDLGRIILFGSLIVLSYFVPTRWVLIVALIIGGIGSLLFTLMPRAQCEVCHPTYNRKIRLIPKLRPDHEAN
jgi:sugar phosphate permease